MAEVNEEISRLYFESRGFLVRTNLPYYVQSKDAGPGGTSDIDLLIANLAPKKRIHLPFVLKDEHLAGISKAAVEVKGWHAERLTPSLSSFERIGYFTRPEALKATSEFFHSHRFKRILTFSSLAKTPDVRRATEKKLRAMKIDHVIEFETMIGTIYDQIETNKAYNSEVQQTI